MNIDLNYIMSSLSSQQLYNCWMHKPTAYRHLVSSQQLYNCWMHQPTCVWCHLNNYIIVGCTSLHASGVQFCRIGVYYKKPIFEGKNWRSKPIFFIKR